MLVQALVFLLQTFLGLFTLALLLRFWIQAVRAPARNPVSHFLNALTDFMVRPARRVIPGLWGLDLSTLILAWGVQFLLLLLIALIVGAGFGAEVGLGGIRLALLAVLAVIRLSIYIVIGATLVQAILSWVAPHHPFAPTVNAFTRPFLRPFRQHIPPIGNVDLSPLFLLVVCQLLLMLPVPWLEGVVRHLP
ncbi:MAG: YggT family protein [Burkholderiales bacterium]|nr:YggT family protein [Burkholderiales bacterium]